MKRAALVFALILSVSAIHAPTSAAQEEEVRAAMSATLAAWREGNFEAFGQYYHPETRGFFFDGGRLVVGFNQAALQAAHDAGFRATMEVQDIDVKVYGNAAVAIAYLDGSITLPGGTEESGTWRYSETRIRQDGTWKIVQYHFSKLAESQGVR
ncbi:MAG: DUF4440 domain-containing protein [Gemmatimonadales bacterium]|nr:DUF4440 domain-containing protein [Gemmatimonadales bacterium]NIN12977.1 DUF4440 domain-containing protein [Gemmatimonadales bacterium]NIN51054.1 DUF4440 domain-containing protein [Gemmatimonadales bacterium]NIP08518.1 DUF4440 domain-containing protein [Gemmatimonadales bacterium]NIR02236.1 DUF4440 domain-containing protein [Gemmatimonadales bacterium]